MTMAPSGPAPDAALPVRSLFAAKALQRLDALSGSRSRAFGPFARKAMGLSALTALGQASFVVALPVLSRLYTPSDFGVFTIYLSIVNIGGPIVGLKFESALYAARTKQETRATLALSVLTTILMTSAAAAMLCVFGPHLARLLSPAAQWMLWYLPFGLFLAGMWSVSSAWAIKSEATSTLGIARFIQPAAMTALQLVGGFVLPASGVVLIGAHLASHLIYSGFVFSKTITRNELLEFVPARWSAVLKHAKTHRAFPIFVLPAQISYLAVSNLPPLLLSSFYGADIAGHCGVAYRLVAAPVAIASLALGAIFTGVVSRTHDHAVVVPLARKVFLANLAFVSGPILVLGATAPMIAPAVLGERWAITGQIVAAFALIGAAQSLSAPFSETTSIFRSQALRFGIEFAPAAIVVSSIFYGGLSSWPPLHTIWLMSVGGAGASLVGLGLLWRRLPAMLSRAAEERAASAIP
jgi:O-antigen/teichoic acid export membrane protein